MKLYPESAATQLEFDKVKTLLQDKCRFEYAKTKAEELRIHTRKDFIETELKQSHEFRQLLQNSIYFPNDYILNHFINHLQDGFLVMGAGDNFRQAGIGCFPLRIKPPEDTFDALHQFPEGHQLLTGQEGAFDL